MWKKIKDGKKLIALCAMLYSLNAKTPHFGVRSGGME